MVKLCPDFKYPCIKTNCISYMSEFTYMIDTPKFMDILCKDLNYDFTKLKYPIYLNFSIGFCKKYSEHLEYSKLLNELNRIQYIVDSNYNVDYEVVYV